MVNCSVEGKEFSVWGILTASPPSDKPSDRNNLKGRMIRFSSQFQRFLQQFHQMGTIPSTYGQPGMLCTQARPCSHLPITVGRLLPGSYLQSVLQLSAMAVPVPNKWTLVWGLWVRAVEGCVGQRGLKGKVARGHLLQPACCSLTKNGPRGLLGCGTIKRYGLGGVGGFAGGSASLGGGG